MSNSEMLFSPPDSLKNRAHLSSLEAYRERYRDSLSDPEGFWAKAAQRLNWFAPWQQVLAWNFQEPRIEWFRGGKLNVSCNCLDRHVAAGYGDVTALLWEGNEPMEHRRLSYTELLEEVERAAAMLRVLGVRKGDRVAIYLQMIPELMIAMLACTRIGAIHSVVFGAFSAESLAARMNDAAARILITQDTGVRGAKHDLAMKATADRALGYTPSIETVLVVRRTGASVAMTASRDRWWHEALGSARASAAPEWMDAEDPLFILYTSGSTGKPKGVVHTTGGYLLYASLTHELVFDYHPGDVYWCTADIGWITGHSYTVYGPLANRATVIMFEGVPNYPDFSRYWQIIEKYGVNTFYTAPTALRALMKEGDTWPARANLSSLRILGTVGEPIKAPEWLWYYRVIGQTRCPIVDTWWQTETGGVCIAPLPAATPTKPGSSTLPLLGIQPVILDDRGTVLQGEASGNLALAFPWPGITRTLWADHARFKQTYFSRFPGFYITGDRCRRDADGYYWITGRVDDMMTISGHTMGTAEIEGAIGRHPAVAEAAVVAVPDELTGSAIYAFVTLRTGLVASAALPGEIRATVRECIGAHACPKLIQFTDGLPKTRSGKIMRRILRAIATGATDSLGDTSTLADQGVVELLVQGHRALVEAQPM